MFKRTLTPKGIVVTQADNLVFCPYSLEHILRMFGTVFPRTGSYFAVIPSFGGFSGYCWGSSGSHSTASAFFRTCVIRSAEAPQCCELCLRNEGAWILHVTQRPVQLAR